MLQNVQSSQKRSISRGISRLGEARGTSEETKLKVLVLPDNLYEYLNHVVHSYSRAGHEPEEGLAIYQLNQAVGEAQSVDVSNLGKIKLEKLGPGGVTMTIAPEEAVKEGCTPDCTPNHPCHGFVLHHSDDTTFPASVDSVQT